jgi:hypothetical protein
MSKELSITEELDFQYLLELLPPLENTPEFANLPELFSIVGAKTLIKLCKYAGGETITLPTLDQLYRDINALQFYYDVYVKGSKSALEIPPDIKELVQKIRDLYSSEMQ